MLCSAWGERVVLGTRKQRLHVPTPSSSLKLAKIDFQGTAVLRKVLVPLAEKAEETSVCWSCSFTDWVGTSGGRDHLLSPQDSLLSCHRIASGG